MVEKKIKKIAQSALKESGQMLLKSFASFDRHSSELKSQKEIVTLADLASEKMIVKKIKENFPTHQILSEESGKISSFRQKGANEDSYLWVLDPIDGTTNFSMKNPLWSISLAVLKNSEIILGLVYAPSLKELFIAEQDGGTKLNGKKIMVSDISKSKVINTYCHASTKRDMRRAVKYYNYQKFHGFDCRQLGSAAIELAFVAAGRIESIVIPGAHSWDVAAGALLVKEAGGQVTDFFGRDWGIKSKDIAASNSLVHQQVLHALKK